MDLDTIISTSFRLLNNELTKKFKNDTIHYDL